MKNFDSILRGTIKLPCLKVTTFRSTSANLHNNSVLQHQDLKEMTPYFKHARNQSDSIDHPYVDEDFSFLCRKILKEQSALKQRINQQEKIIKKICKNKFPSYCESPNFPMMINNEISAKKENCPQSAKDSKRFKFPRDVFTRKVRNRT